MARRSAVRGVRVTVTLFLLVGSLAVLLGQGLTRDGVVMAAVTLAMAAWALAQLPVVARHPTGVRRGVRLVFLAVVAALGLALRLDRTGVVGSLAGPAVVACALFALVLAGTLLVLTGAVGGRAQR